MAQTEKRVSQRIVFPGSQQVKGVIRPRDNGKTMTIAIINLSTGGLHMVIDRESTYAFKPGDRLELLSIEGLAPLQALSTVAVEVKWILDHDFLAHVGLGCEFKNLTDSQSQLINQYIDSLR